MENLRCYTVIFEHDHDHNTVPSSWGTKFAESVLSEFCFIRIGSSTLDPGLCKPASSWGRSLTGISSSPTPQGTFTRFTGSGDVTITGIGLPLTWRLNFLTPTRCLPVSLGINETDRELSELRTSSSGSSSGDEGRVRVPEDKKHMRKARMRSSDVH